MKKWLQEFLKWFEPESGAARTAPTKKSAQPSGLNATLPASTLGAPRGAPSAGPSAPASAAPLTEPTAATSRVVRRRPRTMKVYVGLDFGTSVSKVMFNAGGAGIRPLELPGASNGHPKFFVPSLVCVANGDRLLVGSDAHAHLSDNTSARALSRFKMLVAGMVDSRFLDERAYSRYQQCSKDWFGSADHLHPDVTAAVFIADTMRLVRKSLEEKQLADELDIEFNTCVPIDQVEHEGVKRAFDRVAAIAQRLYETTPSDQAPSLSWLDQAGALRTSVSCDQNESTRLFVFPEAVASFATYKESLSRQEGIHALIDIGAGTTDVSIIYLALPKTKTAGTQCWSARSVPMGMGMIEDAIFDALGEANLDQETLQTLLRSGKLDSLLTSGLQRIWDATESTWSEAYGHYPGQGRWSARRVRVFLAGGGAEFRPAQQVFSRSWKWKNSWGPYPVEVLPTPDDFAGGQSLPFHRLSVAYGLCRPGPDLDVGILPTLAGYYPRPPASYREEDPFDGPT